MATMMFQAPNLAATLPAKSVLEMGPMEIMALQETQLARVRMAAQ